MPNSQMRGRSSARNTPGAAGKSAPGLISRPWRRAPGQPPEVGFQRRGPGPPAFVPRGGMGDGGLHRYGITIPGPVGPPIVPFPRKRAASSATGCAWPSFPHVSGGGLRGRYLCAKDTSSLPCSGNYPLREHGGQRGRRFRHLRSPGPHVSNRFPPWGHAKRPGPRLLADRGVMKPERLISSRCSWG